MQIVINISEKSYKNIKEQVNKRDYPDMQIGKAIVDGAILPKGHGNLVDYEELKNNAGEYGAYVEATLSHIKPKTIIEADVAESEE